MEVVKRCTNVHTLSIKNNGLRNEGAIYVCNVAKTHPSLVSIDFSENAISLTAADEILKLIRENPKIVQINLNGTRIEVKNKLRIEKYLQKNQQKK
mmetsp:Transcript_11775/g.17477  ORF Transcript_11775/g.17477 Transcript_11775/m.17477 type:complete len:96 (+) Transcript_11775:651-938(+)